MNPFISLLNKAKKGFCSLLNLYRKHPSFIRIVITVLVLFSFFVILSIYLPSCKSPATLTSDTQHHARDSTRHTTVHRIETHDTIVIGPSKSPLKGEPEGVLLRISDRTITLHDTVYICRTDTLIRTQTITVKERYIPPFCRFCTITLATLATFATLAFINHLHLRYLKTR